MKSTNQDNHDLIEILNDSWELLWLEEEKNKFNEGLRKFGRDYKLIQQFMGTKNQQQCKDYGQRLKIKLLKENDSKDADLLKILQMSSHPLAIDSDGKISIKLRGKFDISLPANKQNEEEEERKNNEEDDVVSYNSNK